LDFETGQTMVCETKCRKNRIVMMLNDMFNFVRDINLNNK